MAADEKVLGALHTAVAEALSSAVKGEVLPDYEDENGAIVPGAVISASPAMLQAAIKFLKDNNVTCEPSKDNALGELERAITARRTAMLEKNAQRQIAEDTQFLSERIN